MPKRSDLSSVLLIGSGPIVIGQACEFDYSGTQACKALREEGLRVILVNSNPATIMTDPDLADATYIEPLRIDVLDRILEREKPDALLATLGGQTALNLAMDAAKAGILEKHGVELIGASIDSIDMAEDRARFREAMTDIGLETPRSAYVTSLEEARACIEDIHFPAILRPSFTMGGAGASIAYNAREYDRLVQWALDQSPTTSLLVEQSVLGWKEYELEVMRDVRDNVVIVCSIENFDPMGVHTGDSITVAPAQTLTDREYQRMRDAAIAVIRKIGVDTGGSNIQFAVNPANGDQIVIEMNPRVSRSSALASKATGFAIAKLAAKLAIGYTLDELDNDITGTTPASFEPTIDYVVTKMPRFAFEKFPNASRTLGTQMKSVGEVMAIGRTFRESLGKAIRSLETGRAGFDLPLPDDPAEMARKIATPGPERMFEVAHALRVGVSLDEVHRITHIDPWFLHHIDSVIRAETNIAGQSLAELESELRTLKLRGLSDRRIAEVLGTTEVEVRAFRKQHGIVPAYKRVDTCAAEFASNTPYMYSTYDQECEAAPTDRHKVVILGGGPVRIGQGIEFDYCCVHAVQAVRELGYEAIMVNCNPETVSTDYDTSDRLYFEPVTLEDVLAICELEKPEGVIVQFGGQTPLKLSHALEAAGVKLLGTPADAIDAAEDRERFGGLIAKLGLKVPSWGIARNLEEARTIVLDIGYPVMVRPSYVLGGRAMERIYTDTGLERYFEVIIKMMPETGDFGVLVDQFLDRAVEIDIDVLCDKDGTVVIGGVMEHIEEAGIHSGDSACALPAYSIDSGTITAIEEAGTRIAVELGVVGLMNMQVAVTGGEIYIIEVNPRASRTVPFVSKAIGVPLAKVAAKLIMGKTLGELGVKSTVPDHISIKEAVFPFIKFDETDTVLGPEMRSTGEVMGIDLTFGAAFAKAQDAAGNPLPTSGRAFMSLRDADKAEGLKIAKQLTNLGFSITATHGTATFLHESGISVERVNKVQEGRPHSVDGIENGDYDLVINTTSDSQAIRDSYAMRRAALICNVSYLTTVRAGHAAALGIAALRAGEVSVRPIQSYHK